MKKLTLFLIANSKINKRFRKGEDFIMGVQGWEVLHTHK